MHRQPPSPSPIASAQAPRTTSPRTTSPRTTSPRTTSPRTGSPRANQPGETQLGEARPTSRAATSRAWGCSGLRGWATVCGWVTVCRWATICCGASGLLLAGCEQATPPGNVQVIGQRGVDAGHFSKPRAIELDAQDQLYVVDMTGRVQVLDRAGKYLRSWRTPEIANGKPCGLGFSRDGLLMVADTHYFRVLFYQTDGTPVPDRTIGGSNGRALGEFGFVTDAVQDQTGNYYVSEYGDFDRIQKFDSSGTPLCQWGEHGSEPGQFLRPQALAIDESNQLWVADACNHRLQIFDLNETPPKLVRVLGREGSGPGEFKYPYGIWLGPDDTILVAEFGNHRVQRLRRSGEQLAVFGSAGRGPGQFHQPWSLVLNSQGEVIALDSYNHRLQKFRFETTE